MIDPAAVANRDPAAAIVDLGGETMGTTWHVRLAAPRGFDAATVQIAIEARLDGIVAEMSHWEPASLLSRFNRAAGGQWCALPPDFATVMAQGLTIAGITDGAFDPAIGLVVDLWGFGPRSVATPPTPVDIEAALARSGWRRLAFDAGTRRLRQPGGLSLDLSGIAKGHAVDAVTDLLHARGIRHALIEIGGELAGRGLRPDGEPWWVDLEVPPIADLPSLRIALHGLSVATSGNYRRGEHTIDSRTGRAATGGIISASVIHSSTLVADAWATALTVLGAEKGTTLAGRMGIAARIITHDDVGIREMITAPLAAMLAD
ncbi:FAD:protein FMN transferase [Sphingomonas cynarae]